MDDLIERRKCFECSGELSVWCPKCNADEIVSLRAQLAASEERCKKMEEASSIARAEAFEEGAKLARDTASDCAAETMTCEDIAELLELRASECRARALQTAGDGNG